MTKNTNTLETTPNETGESCRTSQPTEPGAYVNNETGLLHRITPKEAILGTGLVTFSDHEHGVLITKISSNPWIPVGQARLRAANLDLPVNF